MRSHQSRSKEPVRLSKGSKDNRIPNVSEGGLGSYRANQSNTTIHIMNLLYDAGTNYLREENNRMHLRSDREAIMHRWHRGRLQLTLRLRCQPLEVSTRAS